LPGKPRKVPFFVGNWMAGFRGKVDGKKITATAVFQLEKNPNISKHILEKWW